MSHPIIHHTCPESSASVSCSGVGLPSVGSVGAFGWVRGRVSARSAWRCCPGCGLHGDGTLCMACDVGTHGEANSCTMNSTANLRMVRRAEVEEGTTPLLFPPCQHRSALCPLIPHLKQVPLKPPLTLPLTANSSSPMHLILLVLIRVTLLFRLRHIHWDRSCGLCGSGSVRVRAHTWRDSTNFLC